jgi:AAA family ATP:ADP antiporter
MLRGITLYLLLMTWVSTTMYFEQAQIVAAEIQDSTERAALFARMDLAVNAIAVTTQLLLTGRLIRWLGLGSVLVALPAVSGGSLVALSLAPTLGVLVGVQVVRRAVNYALSKPARELLYTVVDREAKYKGKNVVDTFVYRGGDAVAGWAFAGLRGLGLPLPAISWLAVPVTALWARAAIVLARLARA